MSAWALALMLAAAPAGAAVRFALVVGNNLGVPGDRPLKWAEADAQRVHRLFIELGAVDRARATLLEGAAPGAVQLAAARLSGEVAEARRRGERTEVFVYYSGHGDKESLHLSDEVLPRSSLQAWLAAVPADVVLTIIDACRTGAVRSGAARGLSKAPAFDVRFARQAGLDGQVVVESAGLDEVAQESDDLEGGFFTHQLLTGLRGAADSDADQQVSVAEVYRYAYDRTVASSFGTAPEAQHPSMTAEFQGEGELIVTALRRAGARLRLQADLSGEVLLVDDATARVVAELRVAGTSPLELALPVGDYRVLRREGTRVWAGTVRLLWAQTQSINAGSLTEQERVAALTRGAKLDPSPWRLWAGATLSRPRALLSGLGLGGRVGVELRIEDPLFVAVRVGGSTAWARGASWDTRHTELSIGASVGVQRAFGMVRLAASLGLEAVAVFASAMHLNEERLLAANLGPTRTRGWTVGPALCAEAWLALSLPAGFELRVGGGMSLGWVKFDGQVREAFAPFAQLGVAHAL